MSIIRDYNMAFNEKYDKISKKRLDDVKKYFDALNMPLYDLDKDGNINKTSNEFKLWKKNVLNTHKNLINTYSLYLKESNERKKKFAEHNFIYHRDLKYENALHHNWRRIIENGNNGISTNHFIIRDDIGIFDKKTGDVILLFVKKYDYITRIENISNKIKKNEMKPHYGLNRRSFLAMIAKKKYKEILKNEKLKNLEILGNL